MLEGRGFETRDTVESTDRVAVLNEAAARFVNAESPIGRRVRLMLRSGPGPWLRVVGVVANVRHHGLGAPVAPEVYVPYAQAPVESMVFVMRSTGDPSALAAPVRDTLKQLDSGMRVPSSAQQVVADLVQESVAEPRLHAIMINAFGALALTLATVGIVGIVAFTVAQERRDIGVRLALGAEHRHVVFRVVRQGMTLVGVGAALGVAGGLLAARLLEGLLFGVSSSDLPTVAAAVALVLVTGLAGAYVPARRIATIDPIEILRPE